MNYDDDEECGADKYWAAILNGSYVYTKNNASLVTKTSRASEICVAEIVNANAGIKGLS